MWCYIAFMRTHLQIDELNLALGRAIAEKLRAQPELFDTVVRPRLRRWRQAVESGDAASRHYLEQWEGLAAAGIRACIMRVCEQSEEAIALRQASPFAGVLTSLERMAVIRSCRAANEARRS